MIRFSSRVGFLVVFFGLLLLVSSRDAYAAVSVSCSGTSGSPTAVDEASLSGQDVTFTNGGGSGYCVLDNSISATSVTVNTGVTITHTASDTDGITITTTGDFTLSSGAYLNANGKGCVSSGSANGYGPNTSTNVCAISTSGYGTGASSVAGSGGGYGGSGGASDAGGYAGGTTYGSSTAPTLFGSSGGNAAGDTLGGSGGGLIRIVAGNLALNGSISANGNVGSTGSGLVGGGGAGGSVYITVSGVFSGSTGTISANGGNGGDSTTNANGGGGGGGMISLYYASSTFSDLGSNDFSVTGGTGPDAAADGTRGTVYVKDTTTNAVNIYFGFRYATDYTASTWTVDSTATNQTCTGADASPSITTTGALSLSGTFTCTHSSITGVDFSPGGAVTFNGLTLTMSAQDILTLDESVAMTITGNSTINANVQWTNLTTLTIDAGSSILANSLGCVSSGSANGYGPNTSTNVCAISTSGYGLGSSSVAGSGGGYGGSGGASDAGGYAGGTTYGSSTAPTLFGSSGGNAAGPTLGGSGGGLIRIVAGNLTLNGSLSANGGAGSAGSGLAGGGGSGGSVYITVSGVFSGSTGTISANGGNGGDSTTNANGGGGGGGRVSIYYGLDSFTGTLASTFTAASVAAGGSGPDAAADGSTGTRNLTQTVYLASMSITDNSGYTNDATPQMTLSSSGATPTHMAFSCDGTNWSSWLTWDTDAIANDGDGPAFNMTTDATNCSATNELKTIRAKIKDGSSESSAVSDTTTYDTAAPTVSNVTSTNANGTVGAGDVVTVTVVFDDATMQVSGTPQLLLDMDGTDRQANYASTSTTTLSFTYTIVTGDNKTDLDYASTGALTLNGGTITDLAGNTATLTLASPGAAGSLGANKAINVVTNQNPTVATVTAVQGTDGTGDVTITFIMDDPDDDNTLQAKIEYSLNGGSSWNDPTISTTGSETSATYGDPSVDNAATYQVGQASAYITSSSGANTVTIVWEAATDVSASTDIANAKIRVTPYDALVEGTAASSSNFILDVVDPTGASGFVYGSVATVQSVFSWTVGSDTNFSHYELWYASLQSDAENRTGGAVEWDDSDAGALATASTATTTVTGNLENKYAVLFVVDDFGNATSATTLFIPRFSGSESTSAPSGGGGGSSPSYTVTLTAPHEDDVYAFENPITLTWSIGGADSYSYVDLYFSTDGRTFTSIAQDVRATTRTYTWTPEFSADTLAIVRIDATDLVDVLDTDYSDPFFIAGDPASEDASGNVLSTSPTVHDTQFIKGSSWPTVYAIDGTTRHPFLDTQTFFTYADDFSDVVTVDDDVLSDYTMGSPMLPNPGTILIKVESVAKVYLTDESGDLRWITSEEVATALFGSSWADYVIDVPVTAWAHFTFGDDVESENDVEVNAGEMKTREEVND